MAEPARTLSAVNDPDVERAWREAPEGMRAEIVDGEVIVHPRPSRPHIKIASELGMDLGPPFVRGRGGPGGWVILDEPELWLGQGPDKLIPDLAGWRRERMPDVMGGGSSAYFDVAPDWVCEIVSPSTEQVDRGKKMRIYAREQVSHLWVINPLAQTLEVYRLQGQKWLLLDTHACGAVVRAEPFDAIELALAELWKG